MGALAYRDLAVHRSERALDFVLREGLARIDNPANQARICYVLAMIHARHLPPPDYKKAESYIEQGLAALERADLSEEDRAFLRVFILNGLAFIRHRQGRARDAYTRALDLDPGKPLPRLGRAQAHALLGQTGEARADYTAALDQNPNQPLLLANRAVLWFQEDRLDEALADLDRAVGLASETADLYFNRAAVYEKLGRIEEMERDLRSYLEKNPGAEDRAEVEARMRS